MLKSLLQKLGNWLLGFLMFNTLWLFLVMAIDLILHKAASMPEVSLLDIHWGWFTLPAWTLFRLVLPFDVIVFLNKVQMAFDEAMGLEKKVVPEVWTELEIEEEGQEQKSGPEAEKQKANPA